MAIPKPIEEIQVGDRVLSYNEETGQNQVKTVSQTFTSSHEKVVKVRQSNGQVITSSYGHPYYTKRGWIAAENLKAGDILQTVNGETVIVEFVEHVLLESSVTLYNFEVDGNHNYYVADSVHADTSKFVLVHNKGCDDGKPSSPNRIEERELKRRLKEFDLDPHEFKKDVLKDNNIDSKLISHYDVYIDTDKGFYWLKEKMTGEWLKSWWKK